MTHLVYCDNSGSKGERVIDKIIAVTKTITDCGAAERIIRNSRVNHGITLLKGN